MKLKGSDIVVECLLEQGVDTVFGYPGGTILEVYDSLYKYQDKINHVLTSHEQGAAHAADGYARATGKVGVCMATSGPGATNLVTGIATAYMDSIPLVAITANVAAGALGKDSFQEIDIKGVTIPVTKHNFIVKNADDLAPTIRRAFKIAASGRPGPVLVDITKNATVEEGEYTPEKIEKEVDEQKVGSYKKADIEKAIAMIEKSERPFIFVGGGAIASGASEALKTFVERIDAPVCDSLMGKGAFDNLNPRYTGMLGMHGTKTSNLGVSRCDLLITIGARFSDRVTGNAKKFASNAKKIHIDIDEAEINKNIRVDLGLIGDAKAILEALNLFLKQQNHPAWMKQIRELKERYPLKYDTDRLTGPYIIEQLDLQTDSEAIISTDVGQHQMWAAQYYHFRHPRQLLTSGGLGTMGYGLGACIGAKYGVPDKPVINIAGDGCFRMNMNELATASRYGVPIIQIVFNNHVLGMVRQWQTLFYGKRYSNTVLHDKVDFVKVAEGLGCEAVRVTTKEEAKEAIARALESDRPFVIDAIIDDDDKVYPMVAPGAPIASAFDADDVKNNE
ncbi:biosynthetic-type acetolactate synthase large subunit [Intestinibaculum porci]|uniref:biosynthetic-type acetolactate synthase large subunit n=1 Tax=Intestinibaculum porci TaxID=2487118 RepID=UPI002409F72D|nr:biosynthetic-type acetolactate synthase large subunit [Intestinibaculum porci]MDD6348859.1 biosynthetic-type acetolactate synthase large subunit [Intestinibaculum porci]MDD6421495.1 biosynthetic-type acetolactate synthase large subunit [Intestinibaculum porci]